MNDIISARVTQREPIICTSQLLLKFIGYNVLLKLLQDKILTYQNVS